MLADLLIDDDFNPRSHERSDGYGPDDRETIRHFNPRSHERSDNVRMADLEKDLDFNPRSHERSDRSLRQFRRRAYISIHAPTRGATYTTFRMIICFLDFNPRSHERSDGEYTNVCYQ